MKRVLIGLVRFYQIVLSRPLHWLGGPGAGCRFTPTCSHFFLEAVQVHGAGRGAWLGFKRLLRCHPWGGHGVDPVPPLARGDSAQPPNPAKPEPNGREFSS